MNANTQLYRHALFCGRVMDTVGERWRTLATWLSPVVLGDEVLRALLAELDAHSPPAFAQPEKSPEHSPAGSPAARGA